MLRPVPCHGQALQGVIEKKPREGTGSFSCWWQGQSHCEHRPLWSPRARAHCLSLWPRANRAQLLPGPCSSLTVSLTDIPQIHVRLVSPRCCPRKTRGRPRQGGVTLTLSAEHGKPTRPKPPAQSRIPGSSSPRNTDALRDAHWQAGKRRCTDTGGPCTAQGSLPTSHAGRQQQHERSDPPRELKGAAGVAKSPQYLSFHKPWVWRKAQSSS